ncbi:MAG: hypothetical protein ACF8R7_03895 [Phycisphaerales bacterium JB039]
MQFRVEQLIRGVRWWELAGHDQASLRQAWRQTHYAAQAAAEIGKSWGEPAADDSHTSLSWLDGAGLLQGAMLGQVASAGENPVRSAMRMSDLRLLLLSPAGAPLEQTALAGRTLPDAIGWIRAAAETHAGPAAHEAVPAPDLPEHPLAKGAKFAATAQLAQVELIRLYANASHVLERISAIAAEISDPVRIWPHHFDIATLLTLDRSDDGSPRRTLGLGLTPPDGLIDDGYWYVSGWSATPLRPGATRMPALAHGRWIERTGSLPMAVLPISAVTAVAGDPESIAEPGEQQQRVADFLATAANASLEALDHE